MTISSRTPEGTPSHCPLCGQATNIEFSQPAADATCPSCGCLLLLATETLERLRGFLFEARARGLPVTADTPLYQLGNDSIYLVELIMELEEEFGIAIPDHVFQQMTTVGDVIRFLEKCREAT